MRWRTPAGTRAPAAARVSAPASAAVRTAADSDAPSLQHGRAGHRRSVSPNGRRFNRSNPNKYCDRGAASAPSGIRRSDANAAGRNILHGAENPANRILRIARSNSMGRVQDKVAIVTGAASGVGREDALGLAREGAKVVITDVNEEGGRALAKEIGDSALFMRLDIASEDDWRATFAATQEKFGKVDALINNAAILAYGTIEDTSLELWQKVQRINSDGYFLGCKYAVQAMKERGGSIVNMSSMAGIGGVSGFCAYSASKGAVAALTRSIAAHCKVKNYKIRCNSIHPDGIKTPMVMNMHSTLQPGQQPHVRDPKNALSRFAEPADIANLVLFLASDESRFINGAEIRIDNGYLMWAD
jgi:3(or 17)beta-hydroxysteroid dehydrogenase